MWNRDTNISKSINHFGAILFFKTYHSIISQYWDGTGTQGLHCGYHCCWWPGDTRIRGMVLNSLWPSDTIWHHRSWSTLAQVIAWCLMAPSNYLNQCWLLISEVLRFSPESNVTLNAQANIQYNEFVNHNFEFTATSPRGQWVLTKWFQHRKVQQMTVWLFQSKEGGANIHCVP